MTHADTMPEEAALLDLVQDAVLVRTLADGAIAFWNRGAEVLYGWTRAEANGRACHELLRTSFPRPLPEIHAALLDGGSWEGELVHTRRDGARVVVSSRWTLRRDAAGAELAVVEANTDITARRRAEAHFQSLLESAPDAILTVDSCGRIALMNAQAERLFGYSREELVGRPLELLVPESLREAHRDHRARYTRQPTTRPLRSGLELHARRKDGSQFPAQISLSPLQTEAGVVVISIVRDVTEGKEAELQRLELEREHAARTQAEAALRVRSEVLVSVSHDLQNPLAAIRGHAQLLERRALQVGASPEDQLIRGLAQIRASADRARDQLLELVDASRLEVGRELQLERAQTPLVALARAAVEAAQATTDRHRIVLAAAEDEVVGSWDHRRLARVLDNLLSNALKYSPDGGEVVVRVALETEDGRETAVLAVSDQGVGIPPADLPRLFERFHRGSNVARTAAGTGLGLVGVRRIVEQHGGSMAVESAEGRGSTFTMRLPLADPARRFL